VSHRKTFIHARYGTNFGTDILDVRLVVGEMRIALMRVDLDLV
jgi:hypothetical protein